MLSTLLGRKLLEQYLPHSREWEGGWIRSRSPVWGPRLRLSCYDNNQIKSIMIPIFGFQIQSREVLSARASPNMEYCPDTQQGSASLYGINSVGLPLSDAASIYHFNF